MSASHPAPSPAPYPALRPLPPRPNLEFEHKEAKALLRRLRAGDPEAIARARARHPALAPAAPERARLADAQLVVAREYGFASWPRLVRWFGDVERQRHARRPSMPAGREFYERDVAGWLAAHRAGRQMIGRLLAAYVPRFYGLRVEDVFAAHVTEDDVRLAMARQHGLASWEALLAHADALRAERADWQPAGPWEVSPLQRAGRAMAAADLDALRRVVDAHPELLRPSDWHLAEGVSLARTALHHERRVGAAMRPIVDWLAAQGVDFPRELQRQLCGHMRMKPEKVRWLLDRGADPDWAAPNGIPVLEHALIRYWNGAAVDVLAARATPRRALWIAAGLGDVDGVRRSLDRDGRPTAAARRLRPDFDAVGPMVMPSLPEPDDEELLAEALLVAMCNGRSAVLEYLASRGAPVNSMVYGQPFVFVAVGNGWAPAVESLVRCGADLDLRGWRPAQTPRENARAMLEHMPHDPARRRVAALCGLDPDAILAERDARPAPAPTVDPQLQRALELAGDDAFRLGRAEIGPESLLFGLLRAGGLALTYYTRVSRMDIERFHADVADRVRPADERTARPERPALPLDADAQAAVQAATALVTARRRETVRGEHLLWALLPAGAAGDWLARHGGDPAALRAEIERQA